MSFNDLKHKYKRIKNLINLNIKKNILFKSNLEVVSSCKIGYCLYLFLVILIKQSWKILILKCLN